jgi:hypothetical protein
MPDNDPHGCSGALFAVNGILHFFPAPLQAFPAFPDISGLFRIFPDISGLFRIFPKNGTGDRYPFHPGRGTLFAPAGVPFHPGRGTFSPRQGYPFRPGRGTLFAPAGHKKTVLK